MTIDWEYLKDCHNKRHGTDYSTPVDMLKRIYAKYETCYEVADILVVSAATVCAKMKAEKLPILPKGNRGIPKGEIAVMEIGAKRIKNMTGEAVGEEIGFSPSYAKLIMERKNIPYKKKWSWKKKALN